MSSTVVTRSQKQTAGGRTEHTLEIGELYGTRAPLVEVLAELFKRLSAGDVALDAEARMDVAWGEENPNGVGESPRYASLDDVPF